MLLSLIVWILWVDNDYGADANLRTSKDLYEQCNRGVNYGRGGHSAVFGSNGIGAALFAPDGLYGISEDKACVSFMMETYQWAQRNPAKVGQLTSPKSISGVPTNSGGLGMYLGGHYVAEVPFKDWFKDALMSSPRVMPRLQPSRKLLLGTHLRRR